MYLNPYLPEKLSGTELNYNFRGDKLKIKLDKALYSISNNQFKLTSTNSFGFNAEHNLPEHFNSKDDAYSLRAQLLKTGNLSVEIVKWNEEECVWNQITKPDIGRITYSAFKLRADSKYFIAINGQITKTLKSDNKGSLEFNVNTKND